jgi:hypothetical protein
LDEINIKEILTKTIINYINNLTHENKLIISNDILSKFAENKSKEKLKSSKTIFKLYSKLKSRVDNQKLSTNFNKWKKTCILEVLRNPSMMLSHSHSKIPHIIMNESKTNSNLLGCIKTPKKETLDERKARDDLENCTFKPKVNHNYKFSALNRNPDTYERLYTDHKVYEKKRMLRNRAREEREAKRNSFNPDLTLTKNKFTQSDGFLKRQNSYREKKWSNMNLKMSEIETSNQIIYTFKPRINSKSIELTKDDSSSPRFKKLYNLRNKKEEISLVQDEEKSPSKQVNFKRIEELYNEYKHNNELKRKLIDEVFQEDGITFTPKISSKFLPTSTFGERNAKLLEDRKHLNENYYKNDEELTRTPKVASKDLIGRLYNKSLEKIKQKKQIEETQKLDFKRTLRPERNSKSDNFVFTFSDRKTTRETSKANRNTETEYFRVSNTIQERVDTIVYNPSEENDDRIIKASSKKRIIDKKESNKLKIPKAGDNPLRPLDTGR